MKDFARPKQRVARKKLFSLPIYARLQMFAKKELQIWGFESFIFRSKFRGFFVFFWGGDCLRVLPVAFLNFLSSANHGGQHFYSAPSPPQKNNFLLRNIRVMTPPPNTPKFLLQFLTKITIISLCPPPPTHTHLRCCIIIEWPPSNSADFQKTGIFLVFFISTKKHCFFNKIQDYFCVFILFIYLFILYLKMTYI